MLDDAILTAGSISMGSVDSRIMDLATRLSKRHGPVTITKEASGIHLYICDPDLLRSDGKKELVSKHLAINAERFLGIGPFDVDIYPTAANQKLYRDFRSKNKEVPSAISMKTKKLYKLSDLLTMLPIQERHDLFANVKSFVSTGAVRKNLVKDHLGVLVPEWCGDCVPITELTDTHPAIRYLRDRGYDPQRLYDQFECCYCNKALEASRAENRGYSPVAGGMLNSPQGRIIFSVRMNGSRLGYQSRYIDMWQDGHYWFWSNEHRWVHIRTKNPDGSITEMIPPTDKFPKGFNPHKYINAVGSERNKLLMGYDAAVRFNSTREFNKRYCVLVEGPLDAARIGPPAIAILGKSLSPEQASFITKEFAHVVTVMDNDAPGRQCLQRIYQQLPHTPIHEINIPSQFKDIGEMTYQDAAELVKTADPLNR